MGRGRGPGWGRRLAHLVRHLKPAQQGHHFLLEVLLLQDSRTASVTRRPSPREGCVFPRAGGTGPNGALGRFTTRVVTSVLNHGWHQTQKPTGRTGPGDQRGRGPAPRLSQKPWSKRGLPGSLPLPHRTWGWCRQWGFREEPSGVCCLCCPGPLASEPWGSGRRGQPCERGLASPPQRLRQEPQGRAGCFAGQMLPIWGCRRKGWRFPGGARGQQHQGLPGCPPSMLAWSGAGTSSQGAAVSCPRSSGAQR